MLHILFGVYAVSGRERVAPNDGGTANFVFGFYCFCGKNVNFVARKILLVMESKLTLYNTLDRRKETFEPINPPHVGMYVCGPTVYGDPHLGHARPAVTFDLLFRYLRSLGYKVTLRAQRDRRGTSGARCR